MTDTNTTTTEKIVSLPYLLTENMITITAPDGSAKCMDRAHPNFDTVLDAVREGRWEDALREIDVKETISQMDGFEIRDDKVYVRDRELPTRLGGYLLKLISLKMSVDPLLKFWDNLEQNPSFRAVESLFSFLETNQHPLTEDGCFIAYKGVNADWTDCHSGKIDNSIGVTVKMPRNQVDENPERTCSHGLHVGNHEAASAYWGGSGHLLVVKVNPRDVVAIPNDYHEAKMRICEYTVLQETEHAITDTPVYTAPSEDSEDSWDDESECDECGCVDCVCGSDDDDDECCPGCGAYHESECSCGQDDCDDCGCNPCHCDDHNLV